ncbi:DUF4160 domain-containing protein [Burkholderia ubonensis]|uniref:DUF4160 domain-containing protein n=1 Tax=Burkholderia ubonensis TaxID=101571 RepID=UPI00075BCD79|nr:DUF4160 domain-containing protein [Burkholderia ubonensis]
MKVADHKGRRIAVLTRDEHCPPHVHVDGGTWSARFEFAFWHNGVHFLDIQPANTTFSTAELKAIIATIRANLPKARKIWWQVVKDVCLINKYWDHNSTSVVSSASGKKGLVRIADGTYDHIQSQTILEFADSTKLGLQL